MLSRIKNKAKILAQLSLATLAATPAALAQTTNGGIDLSGIVGLVMSLLPLFIVIVIVKALLGAFRDLS